MSIALPLAELLLRLDAGALPELSGIVVRLCAAEEQGHVCLPATELGIEPSRLRASPVVGAPGEFKPLILDNAGRLYLHRYWRYEHLLARDLLARAGAGSIPCDETVLAQSVARHLQNTPGAQRDAAVAFVRSRLSLIIGGPGTGKTRTATMALALLAEQFAAGGRRGRIALAAPTGKAAARLAESLAATLARLDLSDAVRALMPTSASTLHRLLGSRPGVATFHANAENPLPLDALIVDEASMVDLPLMAKLFTALRPETRVLLLGDPHQLASVETGHVLGDLCASPLRAQMTELVENHRFPASSGIYRLSHTVNAGDLAAAQNLLAEPPADLVSTPLPAPSSLGAALRERVIAGFRSCLTAPTPQDALRAFESFRILCAIRQGPYGVEQINVLAEQVLADAGLIAPDQVHYEGRPILIRRNDPMVGLFNGDVGILRRDEDGELRAFFPGPNGDVRRFAPSRLPEHETAYAMTVHKSQGSEFTRVLIILPDADTPVLSRELVYTAVTRARESVELWWREETLRAALERRVTRWSGLADQLRTA